MSDQRIETGADAATSRDADPSEGLGTASPAAHANPLDPRAERNAGGVDEMAQPATDGSPGAAQSGDADTEGARYLQQEQQTVERQQDAEPDLGGREPAGDGGPRRSPGSASAEPARGSAEPARPEARSGEVSAEPSAERRAEDPGSVGREFGDRADSAPDDEIAHPSI
jgi:hypothetical protein